MAKEGLSKDAHTIAEYRFKTEDGLHELYVQEWGNPKGIPVLYLHGGPGAGCRDKHKTVFSPGKHRVILFDQRGSGSSTPYGSLEENTTQKLIEDIELIRTKLQIEKWHLHGLSWGSTLALIYSIAHPDKVSSMVIGGIWLASEEETDWLTDGGWQTFYPDAYERLKEMNKGSKNLDYFAYSSAFIQFYRLDDRYYPLDKEKYDDTPLKIEFHYIDNNMFITKNHILDNAHKLLMPVNIIQGRYDIVTPPKYAYELHKKLPDSELFWTVGGHASSDRANYDLAKALLTRLS
ncbi:MAG TPA: alpha/beta fold hydrolase [Candidatus Saccharimonadales bacterium]|nr:alpha/beta fold hydrolase [Candidatus Saccharimonadales bacterium]